MDMGGGGYTLTILNHFKTLQHHICTHTHTHTPSHTLMNWELNRSGPTVLGNRWRRGGFWVVIWNLMSIHVWHQGEAIQRSCKSSNLQYSNHTPWRKKVSPTMKPYVPVYVLFFLSLHDISLQTFWSWQDVEIQELSKTNFHLHLKKNKPLNK